MTRLSPVRRCVIRSLLAAAAVASVTIWSIAAAGALIVPAAAMLLPEPAHAAGSPEVGPVRIDIKVTDAGFEPRQINVKRGRPTTLAFTRTTDRTCITAIDIPDEDVKSFELPLNRTVTLTITPRKAGVERFHCSAMGMGKGRIVVED